MIQFSTLSFLLISVTEKIRVNTRTLMNNNKYSFVRQTNKNKVYVILTIYLHNNQSINSFIYSYHFNNSYFLISFFRI